MTRVWDPSKHTETKHLQHWWLYNGQLTPCCEDDVKEDFRTPRLVATRCSLVTHHACNGAPYYVKLLVVDGQNTQHVIVSALCSFQCVEALTREPWPLLQQVIMKKSP